MKKVLSTISIGLVLTMLTIPVMAEQLTVIHINDTHSFLYGFGPKDADMAPTKGGVSRLATYIGMSEAYGENPLVLHAGDFFIGDLFFNASYGGWELGLLNMIGVDGMTIGNHEFDLYPSTFKSVYDGIVEEIGGCFPILSCNIDFTQDIDGMDAIILPYYMYEGQGAAGGLTVGVVGATTREGNTFSNAHYAVEYQDWGEDGIEGTGDCLEGDGIPEAYYGPGLVINDIYTSCGPQQGLTDIGVAVGTVAAMGADVVILASHLGFYFDQIVAQAIPGIDILVSGHDHIDVEMVDPVNGTIIVQAGTAYEKAGKLVYETDDGSHTWTLDALENYPKEETVEANVLYYKGLVEAFFGEGVYSTNIGNVTHHMTYGPGLPLPEADNEYDTALGNFIADALYDYENNVLGIPTDCAIIAHGLVRADLYEGDIYGADLFQAYSNGFDAVTGFGFKASAWDMAGYQLLTGLAFTVSYLPIMNNTVLHASDNFKYVMDVTKSEYERVDMTSVRFNDYTPIDPYATYHLAGGEKITWFFGLAGVEATNVVLHDYTMYQVLRDYTLSVGTIDYDGPAGRLKNILNGDVNFDGGFNVLDVIQCVNVALGTSDFSWPMDEWFAADDNDGGTVDVLDVISIVNKVLGGKLGSITSNEAVVNYSNNVISATSVDNIAGMQFTFAGDVNPTLLATNMTMAHEGNIVIVYSADGNLISAGTNDVISVGNAELVDIIVGNVDGKEMDLVDAIIATDFSLDQNYPNPFNPTTSIAYAIPEDGAVNLMVYNMQGQVVRTLVNDSQTAGKYSVTWDGRNDDGSMVSNGMYIYRLAADGRTAEKKMTLLK